MMMNVVCECVVLELNPGLYAYPVSVLPLTYTCSSSVDRSNHLCASHTLPDLPLISPDQQTLFSLHRPDLAWSIPAGGAQ